MYKLQPLKSIRFDSEVPNNLGPSGNPLYLAVCAALAAVILGIAGVNYVNLATARADRRTHEIGVRKALGAHRGQLIRQLLCESVVLSAGATLLGAAATQVLVRLPALITGMDIGLPFMRWTIPAAAGAAALALGVGLAAGAYPAWLVARFQPAAVVRRRRSGARLRQVLVVGQFTVTAALMTMTLLIWSQVDYVQDLLRRDSSLGFEPEQVTVILNHGLSLDQTRVLKSELLQDSRVALVSLSETLPGFLSKAWYEVEGEDAAKVQVRTYGVDGDFFGMMGLRMSRGRALTDDPSDDRAAMINKTAARRMGWEDPLGKTITGYMGWDLRVVGVVEDFHFDGPHKKVEPLLMAPVSNVGTIAVRARPGNLDEVNALIDQKWAALSPPPAHRAPAPRGGLLRPLHGGAAHGRRPDGLPLLRHRRGPRGPLRHGRPRRPEPHPRDRRAQGLRRLHRRPDGDDAARLRQSPWASPSSSASPSPGGWPACGCRTTPTTWRSAPACS